MASGCEAKCTGDWRSCKANLDQRTIFSVLTFVCVRKSLLIAVTVTHLEFSASSLLAAVSFSTIMTVKLLIPAKLQLSATLRAERDCRTRSQYGSAAFLPPVLPSRSTLLLPPSSCSWARTPPRPAAGTLPLRVRRVWASAHAGDGARAGERGERREAGVQSLFSRCASVAAVVASAFAVVLAGPPAGALASEKKSVLTMTDRVSSFTLPSQEAALERERLAEERSPTHGILVKARKIAVTVLPPMAAVVAIVWLASRLMKRAQNRQLRQFQQQLEAFSNNLNIPNLDLETIEKGAEQTVANARIPFLDASTSEQGAAKNDDADNVQLELFRKAGAGKGKAETTPANAVGSESGAGAASVGVETDPELSDAEQSWEKVIIDCMSLCMEIRMKNSDNYEQVIGLLKESLNKTQLNDPIYRVLTTRTVSRVISSKVDTVITALAGNKETQIGAAISQLSHALDGARVIANHVNMAGSLRYVGTTKSKVVDAQVRLNELENVYRRYAMHCLACGAKMTEELKALDELQRILEINDNRAEKINAEIASGMLQAAVAAASADANLSDADRRTLDSLTQAFGPDAGGGDSASAGQPAMSEAAVLKMMQAIQQMMAVQDGGGAAGSGQDDVEMLKKLCEELGVDFEEVIRNAEKFGDQFGATGAADATAFGKDFTDKLKSALPAQEKEKEKEKNEHDK